MGQLAQINDKIVTNFCDKSVQLGDSLELSAPAGKFTLQKGPEPRVRLTCRSVLYHPKSLCSFCITPDYSISSLFFHLVILLSEQKLMQVLIGGGTGITPLMSMLREAAREPSTPVINLLSF